MRRLRPGSVKPCGFEELGALGGLKLRDLGFHGAADADDFGAFFGGAGFDQRGELVAVGDAGFIHVGDVEHAASW